AISNQEWKGDRDTPEIPKNKVGPKGNPPHAQKNGCNYKTRPELPHDRCALYELDHTAPLSEQSVNERREGGARREGNENPKNHQEQNQRCEPPPLILEEKRE